MIECTRRNPILSQPKFSYYTKYYIFWAHFPHICRLFHQKVLPLSPLTVTSVTSWATNKNRESWSTGRGSIPTRGWPRTPNRSNLWISELCNRLLHWQPPWTMLRGYPRSITGIHTAGEAQQPHRSCLSCGVDREARGWVTRLLALSRIRHSPLRLWITVLSACLPRCVARHKTLDFHCYFTWIRQVCSASRQGEYQCKSRSS